MRVYDACIIGIGGVVGSAIARELTRRGLSVVGLERHGEPAMETSGANSCVVHSGFHEHPKTLKADLARAGSHRLIEYAAAKGIRTIPTGMLIAVPHGSEKLKLWRELRSLRRLWRGGKRQHIPFRWILSQAELHKIAPVHAFGGIFIPSVHVVDVMQLVTSLQRDAIEGGADLVYNAPVSRISRQVSIWSIPVSGREIHARALVNSAGLGATGISRLAGGPVYDVEYYRGEYFELKGGVERWGIRTLVYPAMPSRSKSKGIHFGPRADGKLYIGPNVVRMPTRELGIVARTEKDLFLQAARKFLPEVSERDLEWSYAGVRPKYVRPDGISDFLIQADLSDPQLINLIGIDSPGLSASMAIAERVAEICAGQRTPSAA